MVVLRCHTQTYPLPRPVLEVCRNLIVLQLSVLNPTGVRLGWPLDTLHGNKSLGVVGVSRLGSCDYFSSFRLTPSGELRHVSACIRFPTLTKNWSLPQGSFRTTLGSGKRSQEVKQDSVTFPNVYMNFCKGITNVSSSTRIYTRTKVPEFYLILRVLWVFTVFSIYLYFDFSNLRCL